MWWSVSCFGTHYRLQPEIFFLPNEITHDAAYFELCRRLDWHFSQTYCRKDSSQCTDLKMVPLRRRGIRLQRQCSQHVKKNLSGHESLITFTFWICLVRVTNVKWERVAATRFNIPAERQIAINSTNALNHLAYWFVIVCGVYIIHIIQLCLVFCHLELISRWSLYICSDNNKFCFFFFNVTSNISGYDYFS